MGRTIRMITGLGRHLDTEDSSFDLKVSSGDGDIIIMLGIL